MTEYFDYRLRAVDAETLADALTCAGAAWIDNGELRAAEGVALDIIDPWHIRTGGTDEEPTFTIVEGAHCNVRSTEPIDWPGSVELMEPATPWRVWG